MTDSQATILAFAISLCVLAGYGVGVVSRLRRERAKARERTPPADGGSNKVAVSTELKPRNPVGSSIKTS
jgi:hypothetical protein